MATFAGFAPVNNPAITVVVILDSAVGLHQGGQISAPVFQRIAQQVLEYLHTPHDVELPPSRQVLLAERQAKDQDLVEGSPDRLGDDVTVADASPAEPAAPPLAESEPAAARGPAKPSPGGPAVVPAAMYESEPSPAVPRPADIPVAVKADPVAIPKPEESPARPTVVLDVEQGGIVVPSFSGKNVRAAIETASQSGLDLDVVGSGLAQDQNPAAGAHVAAGSRVTVRFGR